MKLQRPFVHYSIDDLESEVAQALSLGDQVRLDQLAHELSFRRMPRALELRQTIENTRQISKSGMPRKTRSLPFRAPALEKLIEFKPTDEQLNALSLFNSGGDLKINAFAGSGKTSTLQLLASSTGKIGQYIAFNRSIVSDARQKFPDTVNCSTVHALAFRATHSNYKKNIDKLTGKISPKQLAEMLKLKRWRIDQDHTLEPVSQAFLILSTARRFMQSGAANPLLKHVPIHGSLITASEETKDAVRDFCLRGTKHIWSRMLDSNDQFPLGHDGYVKLWALSEPRINADYIMLDEAQDTNPVVLNILKNQSAQMVYVGDKYQQIYEWRGAINAMEEIYSENRCYLTMSFRFGQEIADAASKILSMLGEDRQIKGNPSFKSQIGQFPAEAVVARTNASTMTFIIGALEAGINPHLVGDADELMRMLRGVEDLKRGKPCTNVPDFFGFTNWSELVEFAKTPEGGALLTFVNIVESKGERTLISALKKTVTEEHANLIVSTAHKAKGREWDSVRLADDFLKNDPNNEKQKDQDSEELRTFYVALTRARKTLDIPPPLVKFIFKEVNKSSGQRYENINKSDSVVFESKQRPKIQNEEWSLPEDWRSQPTVRRLKVEPPRIEKQDQKESETGLWPWIKRRL